MRLLPFSRGAVLAFLSLLVTQVVATALTYKLAPNEKQCFYTFADKKYSKIAFYFAVSPHCSYHLHISPFLTLILVTGQVQSGGSFDVDYKVTGPNDKIILEGTKERQGDFVFTVNEIGDYSFCFSNDMSTFAEKMVDFEIAVWRPDYS